MLGKCRMRAKFTSPGPCEASVDLCAAKEASRNNATAFAACRGIT